MKVVSKALKELPQKSARNPGHESDAPTVEDIAKAVKAEIEKQKEEPNPFPLDAFPKPIARMIQHWNMVYRRPIDYHAGSILAAASGAIGNAFWVEHVAGATQPLSCWVVIVGPPSSAKSPIMRTCLKPLFMKEKEYGKTHKEEVAEWEAEIRQAKANKNKSATQSPRPKREQRVVSDATIESLIKIFPRNWKGVLSFKDEFIALLKMMNAYKQSGQDLEHYMSMWSGMPVMLNRSSIEDAIFIEQPFIAVLGSIQPGLLAKLTDGGKISNGFWFRLLFCHPENTKIPLPSKEVPDPKVFEEYARTIKRLNDLPCSDDESPLILKMAPKAFKIYDKYKVKTEQEIINQTDDENIMSLYGKMVDYCLRFAAVLELLELVTTADTNFMKLQSVADMEKHRISAASVNRAIKLTDYFIKNSLKILQRTEDPVAALPHRQRALYEKLPNSCTSGFAVSVAARIGISEKTARRLIRNKAVFAQNKDGSYRKLYT